MQLFSLREEKERKEADALLQRIQSQTSQFDSDLRQLIQIELLETRQLFPHFTRGYACHDRVLVFGRQDKFNERKNQPSPVQANEIYDLEEELKMLRRDGFEIIGGLGGFSLENGARAGELILLPGGTAVRVGMENGAHTALVVPPINIYPLAVLTARKVSTRGEDAFLCILEKGEGIGKPMDELARRVGTSKKTITGSLSGRFEGISGYIFTRASPRTELFEFSNPASRNLFIYQNLLADNIPGFNRALHSHGYEHAKLGQRASFGAHLYDARVADVAIGLFSIAKEVVTVHY